MSTALHRRQLEGLVVSDRMQKTVVVRVDRVVSHPKYHKQYTTSARYQVHDEQGQYHRGDFLAWNAESVLRDADNWS